MAVQAKTDETLLFLGRSQPHPTIRLEQIKIFLSDEDFHRCLGFKQKIWEIEQYIRYLRKVKYKGQERLLKEIEEMIQVHNTWITRAEPKPVSYHFVKFAHKNRLLGLIKDRKKKMEILSTKGPPISRDLIPGPSIHKRIPDEDRPASPDPFHFTKAVADVRVQHDSEAEARRADRGTDNEIYLKEPNNFNGPYTPDFMETALDVQDALTILDRAVKKLDAASKEGSRPMIKSLLYKINQIKDSPLDLNSTTQRPNWTTANRDLDHILTLIDPNNIATAGFTEIELCAVDSVLGGRFRGAVTGHARRMQYLNEVLKRIQSDPKFLTKEIIPNIFPGGVSLDNIDKPLLNKIAQPLVTPESNLKETTAARLLQEQIIFECCNNHCSRQPNFEKIWAFAPEERHKNFFALDRWPPELQSKKRREEMKSSGPQPRRKRRHLPARMIEALENEHLIKPEDAVTTLMVEGQTFYPFGETLEEQHVLSHMIETDLKPVIMDVAALYRNNEIGTYFVRDADPEIAGPDKTQVTALEGSISPNTVAAGTRRPDLSSRMMRRRRGQRDGGWGRPTMTRGGKSYINLGVPEDTSSDSETSAEGVV